MSSHFEQIWTPVSQLPHIKFPPNQDLVLGTLLADPKDPRRALSKKPLVDPRKAEIPEGKRTETPEDVETVIQGEGKRDTPKKKKTDTAEDHKRKTQDDKKREETPEDNEAEPWDWDSKEHQTIAGKLWASITTSIPGLGLGLGGSGSSSVSGDVKIHADSVKADWFSPDHAYFQELVKKPVASSYCKKWNKPPVYLVVGILIATNGTFHISKGKEQTYKTNVDAKAAEVAGGGAEAEYSKGKDTILSTSTSRPFVLAYQLVRIKVSRDGSYKEKNFNGFALFDDANKDKEYWEVTPYTPESVFV